MHQVKKGLYSDPRYDAVGSSSLREELFNTYIKGLGSALTKPESSSTKPTSHPVEKESKEARRERALREREQKVKVEQGKVNMDIEKSRSGLNQEEGERVFKCVFLYFMSLKSSPSRSNVSSPVYSRTMLVDAIRDPQVRHCFPSDRH